MIDRVSLLQQALAGLRRAGQLEKAGAPAMAPGASGQTAAQKRASSKPALEARVRLRIAQIGADDPQRRRRALRIIVETSLLAEFGDTLELDPAFQATVDQVVEILNEEPALQEEIGQVLDSLLA